MWEIQFRPLFAYEPEYISELFGKLIDSNEKMASMPFEEVYRTIFINRFPLTELSKESQTKLSHYIKITYGIPIERILINDYIDFEIALNTGTCTARHHKYLFTFNEGPLLEVPFPLSDEPFIRNKHIHIERLIDQSIHFALLVSPHSQTKKAH